MRAKFCNDALIEFGGESHPSHVACLKQRFKNRFVDQVRDFAPLFDSDRNNTSHNFEGYAFVVVIDFDKDFRISAISRDDEQLVCDAGPTQWSKAAT